MERVVGVVVDSSVSRGNGQSQAGHAGSAVGSERPRPEVLEHATRRRFSAEYKLGILRQADACTGAGEIGALLRREGLYSSNLTKWRRQREEGLLGAFSPLSSRAQDERSGGGREAHRPA
jgi:transposase-like protein